MNNILVTGSTGQLGSDVVKELLKRGYSTLSPNRSELIYVVKIVLEIIY